MGLNHSIHKLKNPYPKRLNPADRHSALVLDEICKCSHKRTKHGDAAEYGQGECTLKGCGCQKFTWKEFVTTE